MDYLNEYHSWLADESIDQKTKDELAAITDDNEIRERFYKNLEFGTGGLRGILGAGTNRMNIYTVRKATQGLANYILKQGPEAQKMGVAIAHDCRRMSTEFCAEAAKVLNGNGIPTYVFDGMRPTPQLSFVVRYMGATAGIVITASHNPPEYNGYKVYWSDGGQTPYPRDEEIINEVNAVGFDQIRLACREQAERDGLFRRAGHEVDEAYQKEVREQSINPEIISGSQLKIVYTPLHGTGNMPVRKVLRDTGFQNVFVVPEQEMPDPNFSTVAYPNPEDPKAFELAISLADRLDADIIIGTDPDADRIGVVVRSDGEYVSLTGNMTGALLAEYVLSQRAAKGKLPKNSAVVSTIVSTDITQEIARAYGAEYFNVLTGFKYIGEKIKEFETEGRLTFVYGFEESFGYLVGTHARDKDSVVAALLICEAAAYYAERNMTLLDALEAVYEKYGYYEDINESITLKGIEGVEKIKGMMESLRSEPIVNVDGSRVVETRDYLNKVIRYIDEGREEETDLPVSDVLYYVLEGGDWFCVRPSGTEPKIKLYYGVKADSKEKAKERLERIRAEVNARLC